MAMNQFVFGGFLTKDPQMVANGGDKAKCVLSIAVKNTGRKTDYFRIFVWGKLANDCVKYLHKGKDIIVQGHVESGVNNNDGENGRFFTCFAAEKIDFMLEHRKHEEMAEEHAETAKEVEKEIGG